MKSSGMGIMMIAKNPRRVEAQRGSSLLYICVANSGKDAPKSERMIVFAERAEAASIR